MPTLYLRRNEYEKYVSIYDEVKEELILPEPQSEIEFEDYLASLKTSLLLYDWINEKTDDYIIEKYDVGTGDIYSLIQTAEWLTYAASELAKEEELLEHVKKLKILRLRIKHGVKKELLELVSIPGIGRIRARILYNNGYKDILTLVTADITEIAKLPGIGLTLARKIKKFLQEEEKETIQDSYVEYIPKTLDKYLEN